MPSPLEQQLLDHFQKQMATAQRDSHEYKIAQTIRTYLVSKILRRERATVVHRISIAQAQRRTFGRNRSLWGDQTPPYLHQ